MRHLTFLMGVTLLSGCTDAVSIIESASLSGLILFSGKSERKIKVPVSNLNAAMIIQGTCDSQVNELQISVNGGPWGPPDANTGFVASDFECKSDGKFTIQMSSLVTALNMNTAGDKGHLRVKGTTKVGPTSESAVFLIASLIGSAAVPSSMNISSGATTATGSNFKLKTRMGLLHDGVSMSGSTFKVVPK